MSDLWERFKDSPWRVSISLAIAPLVIGLILSSGFILSMPAGFDWRTSLLAAASAAAFLGTKMNPLWILAAGGTIGALMLS